MNFGEEIRQLRKARGLSQRRVAELLGVTTVTVWNWEAGRVAPWPKRREAILRQIGESDRPGDGKPKIEPKHGILPSKRRRLIDNVGRDNA